MRAGFLNAVAAESEEFTWLPPVAMKKIQRPSPLPVPRLPYICRVPILMERCLLTQRRDWPHIALSGFAARFAKTHEG